MVKHKKPWKAHNLPISLNTILFWDEIDIKIVLEAGLLMKYPQKSVSVRQLPTTVKDFNSTWGCYSEHVGTVCIGKLI